MLRGGCLGGFGEAFRRLLRTPSGSFISMYLHREASSKPPFAHPFRELHHYVFTSRSLQEASISGSFISMYLHRSPGEPGSARPSPVMASTGTCDQSYISLTRPCTNTS